MPSAISLPMVRLIGQHCFRLLIDELVGVQTLSAKRFESGRIVVDNEAEPDLTIVTINERKESSAALLDVASAMTGIGVLIHEAIIQVLLRGIVHAHMQQDVCTRAVFQIVSRCASNAPCIPGTLQCCTRRPC